MYSLLLQWGIATMYSNTASSFSFPINFTVGAPFVGILTRRGDDVSSISSILSLSSVSITITSNNSNQNSWYYLVLGR